MHPLRRQDAARQFHQMAVVGEEQHLGAAAEVAEDGQDGAGAVVVEDDEQVVQDHRHGFVVLLMALDGGKTQGQVELVAGAFAHALNANLAAIAQAHQHRHVVRAIGSRQAIETTLGDGAEQAAGPGQQRPLILFANQQGLKCRLILAAGGRHRVGDPALDLRQPCLQARYALGFIGQIGAGLVLTGLPQSVPGVELADQRLALLQQRQCRGGAGIGRQRQRRAAAAPGRPRVIKRLR